MRLALTVYDDNGALEITSVDCSSFVSGCCDMRDALRNAVLDARGVGSTATCEGPAGDITLALERMGDLEDLPTTITC